MVRTENIDSIFSSKTFIVVLLLKIIIGALFASQYMTEYFIPFVKYFVASGFQNPWNYFYSIGELKAFPYPTVMLIMFSIPFLIISPILSLNWYNVNYIDIFLMRIPLLASDILICFILSQWFRNHIDKVIMFYWCSPIVIYISYYHGQLDAVPTSIFMLTLYLVFSKRYFLSALTLSIAIASKGHIYIAVPFYLIYCMKQGLPTSRIVVLIVIILSCYFSFVGPVFFSEGYRNLVLMAEEQWYVFILKMPLGLGSNGLSLLIVPLVIFVMFMRFTSFDKLNRDVTVLYFAMIFATLVILVPPMPGWYYWSFPLVSYFYIRNPAVSRVPFIVFNLLFLMYFMTYDKSHIFRSFMIINQSIAQLPSPLELLQSTHISITNAGNFIFTLLQGSVAVIAYWIYKEGIISNDLYKVKKRPILIGISGDSGVGKDTTFNCFRNILGSTNCIALSGDDYHKWPRGHYEWKVYTQLHASSNNLHKQLYDAVALRDGNSIVKVRYDHNNGTFTKPEQIDPAKFIFFIGLHTFYIEQMRNLFDIKIYLEPDEALRRYWKIYRDTKERGYERQHVIEQIERRLGDSERFVKPQKQFADIIIKFSALKDIDLNDIDLDMIVPLKLMIKFNNSIFAENLVRSLENVESLRVNFYHEQDLKYQTIEIEGRISDIQVGMIANDIIPNLYELADSNPIWMDNYFGVLQLLLLVYLSNIMRFRQ